MKQYTFLLLIGLLISLMVFPPGEVDACTPTMPPPPTPTYTPTATATTVPPGVTPAPSLTPTPSQTPVPTLTYPQRFFDGASVVFRGRVAYVEKPGEWDESILVAVREYYKGEGRWLVRITGLMTYRLCNYFPGERGVEAVFYVNPAGDGAYYPVASMGGAPDGVMGYSPGGVSFSFGLLESTALGLSTLGGALMIVWMVRPRR